jgi:RNA polymerase sigma-70 factor (ECF subfamily)
VRVGVYNTGVLKAEAERVSLENRQKELLELLDRSGASLYALLTKLTLREDVAEELMQELFIKLTKTSRFNRIKSWNAYAHRAAINLAFDWRRRQKRAPVPLEDVCEPVSNQDSALSELVHREELQETLSAIGQLNGLSREAFVMRYIQEESYERIAEKLGKTEHHVRAMCSRALNHLRDVLGACRSPSCGKEIKDA